MSQPLQVEYENTIEDLVAFNEHDTRRSATVRRLLLGFVLAVLALSALSLLQLRHQDGGLDGVSLAVTFVPIALVVVLAFLVLPGLVRVAARQRLREGRCDALVGPRTLTLEDDGIVERSRTGETRTSWPAVERVVVDDRFVLIYLSAVHAHVVPRGAFASREQQDRFVAAIERHLKPRR
jgi:magnesium-transporting ATPase (P-type)